jgi:hypothetical protein
VCKCCGLDPFHTETVEAVAALAYHTLLHAGRLDEISPPRYELVAPVCKDEYQAMVIYLLEHGKASGQKLYELTAKSNVTPFFMLERHEQETFDLICAVISGALGGM